MSRVLIVDDCADTAESLAILFRLWGHVASVARDGPDALDLARRERPDLILLDLAMPEMNGLEAARRLRALPGLEQVRLVALTGLGEAQDRRLTSEAGFDLHLVKPVEPEELEQLVASDHHVPA